MKRVAVILSGSGVFDGAELHEAVLTLLAIELNGAQYQCFAPDVEQLHVVNHLTGEVADGESRNVLVESARIARGNIKPVTECDVNDFDVLILPGGFGAAKNLCTFAVDGDNCSFNEAVMDTCLAFAKAKKPAAYACIAPALAAKVYGNNVKLTIGNDEATAKGLNALGAHHVDCHVDDVVVDNEAKLVTTPAYMLAQSITEAHNSIAKMVKTVLAMK
ncbi:isoprenoid biosynthesis glyoxalase ElbB [Alteromonas sp. McT4-15]|jgi:enhancing lycopene biosynthesis protein 2|uniref:isoprenoid biosynthesis glyoxalase ElbB n=1 Tax=unclassified Alteromonas TaxID=2614992 RepID=UPI001CF91F01|nr:MULTISPECIES: isoprenoid biosynthesis glyoxalase ElbB [unclassified Alteromonas]MCB4437287.1 isoprenoid biosynthesis glyoxalase ElbB [Alteromonas sp. McT4-15]WDT86179.1 isoprenoid biosynthesis glyoxalase ElbB [Alteromonas sp. 009811495]|tara:strand:- start:1998 stop:2651 length:654 start_codon:yes stop_codon:yes gene_type:complete